MKSKHHTKVLIPGVRPMYEEGTTIPRRVLDKKKRPVWDMPKPVSFLAHFKNAAIRAKVMRGEATRQEAMTMVPLYRGVRNDVYRALRAAFLYDHKLKARKGSFDAIQKS